MITILRVLYGFKLQAKTALIMCNNSNAKSQLAKDHSLIGDHKNIHKKIIGLSKEKCIPIPDLTYQDIITAWMNSTFDFSHLHELPVYFAACRPIGNHEAYFITQYWGDIKGCAGATSDKSQVEMMHNENRHDESRLMSNDEMQLFLSKVKRPDLVLLESNCYIRQ
ncbi:hypothetical protein AB6D11_00290 [Vibrio splendidus]